MILPRLSADTQVARLPLLLVIVVHPQRAGLQDGCAILWVTSVRSFLRLDSCRHHERLGWCKGSWSLVRRHLDIHAVDNANTVRRWLFIIEGAITV